MNRFSKYLSHLLLCVLTTMSVPLPLWSQATQGSLTLSQVDDPNLVAPSYLKATVERTAYAPWVVERSLAMSTGANGPWFSYYQEPGTRISAFAASTNTGPNGPVVDPIPLRLRDLPAYPPPLPVSSPTPGWPRPRYLHAHTILQLAAWQPTGPFMPAGLPLGPLPWPKRSLMWSVACRS